jgi:uncharacterized protein (TIGR03437 family)
MESFLAEQQSPGSPDFRRWLTPEQFGDRFGLTANDAAKVTAWLRAEGLTVHDVARGRHWITFSGTARQVGRAFRTEFHRYVVDGESHFANAVEPSVPEALGSVVAGFNGFDDFGLHSMIARAEVQPEFNSGGSHVLAPDDLATIYNVAPLHAAGIDGSGQKVAVIGQTAIDVNDIRSFRRRFNLPASDPQLTLYGSDPGKTSDLIEANLDLEWAGALAPHADIIYVYARAVYTAAQYAIDQNAAPVITMSYGQCEQFGGMAMRAIAQQANAQGITWVIASGDGGAATCDWQYAPTPQAVKGPTVSFPASLPEVTAVGGTEFNEGGGTYWAGFNNPNSGSALSYIPEKAWNSSAARNQLLAGGGGPSAIFSKPYWQTGPGVPGDGVRDVPDISLSASASHDGYFVVSGGVNATVGGTSVSCPAFAGIVALLNQAMVAKGELAQPGLGNINPELYRLAQSNVEAFHDVVDGDIMVPCQQGSPGCSSGLMGFAAGPRYDLATGLGSVDAFRLVSAWDDEAVSVTTLTADPTSAALGDTVQLTAVVAAAAGENVPTGSVTFLANDAAIASATLKAAGARATATVKVDASRIAAGNNTVTAFYGGDANFGSSSGTASVAFHFSAAAAVVVASVNPNPVVQTGSSWPYIVTLTEKAGVASTITRYTIDGVVQGLPGSFGTTKLPPNGTLSASAAGSGLTVPVMRNFHITGSDDNGQTWTQDFSVPFVAATGPVLAPAMTLTFTPSTVTQDTSADPSCQWAQQVTVQETGGFQVQLTSFVVAGTNLTSKIQSLFGTTRLAPHGTLRATVCFDSATIAGTKAYTLIGLSEIGAQVSAFGTGALAAARTDAPTLTAEPGGVTISAPDGSATVNLSVKGASTAWTATVLPGSPGPAWLTVSPASGTGAAQLQLKAAGGGLSNGVYFATVAVQPSGGGPHALTIPVALVVGASAETTIGGVANAASFATAFAPGMQMSVFGTGLASGVFEASRVPLPLSAVGVSATVNGVTAPLYFVSSSQLNIQIPYETSAGPAVVGVNNNGRTASFLFPVGPVAPGIFATLDEARRLVPSGSGKPGDVLSMYITGDGDLTPSTATGAAPAAGTAVSRLPKPRLPVTVTVGGVKAEVAFVGVPFGLVGVTQINFTIPADAAPGVQAVVVNVGGVDSAAVNLEIKGAVKIHRRDAEDAEKTGEHR